MRRLLLTLALLAVVLLAGGCSSLKKGLFSRKQSPVPADKSKDVFIGVVESVNPEQKFVLVRTELRMVLTPGTKLESRSPQGAKASLVVTPERKMNFLSADVAEGSPAAGDAVILSAEAAAAAAGAGAGAAQPGSTAAPVMRAPASELALPMPKP